MRIDLPSAWQRRRRPEHRPSMIAGRLFPAVMLLATLALAGCAAWRQASRPDPNAEARAVFAQVANNYRRLQTFRGTGRLIIDSPQTQIAAPATVLTRQPDSLYIKLEAIFGVDVGFFFANRQRFESYSPFDNTYFHGNVDQMQQLMLFQVRVTYDEILSGISGAMLPPLDSTFVMQVTDESYHFAGRRDRWQVGYWVDPKRGVVTKAEQRDSSGALYSRQVFRRFRKISGVWLPQWLQLDKPGQRERFTLFYDRVQVNTPLRPADFALRVPPSALRINLSGPAIEDDTEKSNSAEHERP